MKYFIVACFFWILMGQILFASEKPKGAEEGINLYLSDNATFFSCKTSSGGNFHELQSYNHVSPLLRKACRWWFPSHERMLDLVSEFIKRTSPKGVENETYFLVDRQISFYKPEARGGSYKLCGLLEVKKIIKVEQQKKAVFWGSLVKSFAKIVFR